VQNVMIKPSATAGVNQSQESSSVNLGAMGLGAENGGLDQQKVFAEMLTKQLIQQRKMAKTAEVDAKPNPALPNNAELGNVQATTLNGVVQELSSNALTDVKAEQALAIESAAATSPDMMLLQIQTPMAANAPAIKPQESDSLVTMSQAAGSQAELGLVASAAVNLGQSAPKTNPSAPILNDLMTSKNSESGKDVQLDAKDKAESLDLKSTGTSAESVALSKKGESSTQLSETAFKEALAQASANQPATHSITKSEPTTQATAASNIITTAFGKAEWNQAINQKVVWMAGASEQSATLTLNPPDLGPVQVVIQVDNQHVDTTFISDNPEVRQALEDGMQMLRDKMSESGIQLGNAHVNSGEQSKRDAQQMGQESQRQRANNTENQSAESAQEQAKTTITRVSNGLVDTFA